MKDLFKSLGVFLLDILKGMDYKKIIYDACMTVVIPKLEVMVADTESKIDDVIVAGVKQLIKVFLKPKA